VRRRRRGGEDGRSRVVPPLLRAACQRLPRRTLRRRRAVSTLASILAPMIHYSTGCKGSVPFPATSGADTVPLSLIRIGEGESARGECGLSALLAPS